LLRRSARNDGEGEDFDEVGDLVHFPSASARRILFLPDEIVQTPRSTEYPAASENKFGAVSYVILRPSPFSVAPFVI
jgi:hypothetical protein